MLIIAVSGKLGSGKDYVTNNYILKMLSTPKVTKMAFADHIKVTVASQRNWSLERLLAGDKTQEERRALQIAGTEQGRDVHGPDIWVTTMANWIKLRQLRGDDIDVVLVTDCRFPNEAKWVEDNGGFLCRVNALDRHEAALRRTSDDPEVIAGIRSHVSETALDDWSFMYAVDNSVAAQCSVGDQVRHQLQKFLRNNLEYTKYFGNLTF